MISEAEWQLSWKYANVFIEDFQKAYHRNKRVSNIKTDFMELLHTKIMLQTNDLGPLQKIKQRSCPDSPIETINLAQAALKEWWKNCESVIDELLSSNQNLLH